MKIKSSHKKLQKKIIALLVVLLVVGYVAAAFWYHLWPFIRSTRPATTGKNDSAKNIPVTANQNSKPGAKINPTDKTPKQFETPANASPPKNALTGIINYKSVIDGELVIRVTLYERPSSGACSLTLTHGSSDKIVKKSADIVADPSSSTCDGFNIPVSELSGGTWKIQIDLTSGKKTGQISGEVVI